MKESTIDKPTVGITTYQEDASWRGWHRHASLVPTDFVAAVTAAGGVPVLLPPSGAEPEAASVMAGLDGLLLVGGADIDPARYRAEPGPWTGVLAPERDIWESALLRLALEGDRAVLGVCRGMQLMNVLYGGTLLAHLPDRVGNDDHMPSEPVFSSTRLTLRPDALPGTLLGAEYDLPCFHHQAVDTLGAGVVATGWSADGVVETLTVPDARFALGIQGHPEVGPCRPVFGAFVAAAAAHRFARDRGGVTAV
ncbi:glutamine amidotransferase [Streptomyces albireticuli]|uniref:Glutamine amidotransferase n=1 Tax=Streptomyces albireticuli TaxID=1940 RepID=A0A1Z2LCY9_9ACTN|nr:gamma-glutamyl-gamma-aminobutyrate hydrolase family protein [Streptomyces albireticuli]ARZ72190.1 glutamine amidotransferase [Streptomyces albireticuli]